MPCDVVVAGEGELGVDLEALRAFADDAARALDRVAADWCVVLGDDAFLCDLNATYRNVPTPTDVLSFPQVEFPAGPNRGAADVLGDVVISVETAARQAEAHGHGLQAEIEVLVVHGLCHLLGWDHEDPTDAIAMRAVEGDVLERSGRRASGLVRRSEA